MLNLLYVIGSFGASIAAILLIVAFWSGFKKLTILQKIAIILVAVFTLIPVLVGTVAGFLSHMP